MQRLSFILLVIMLLPGSLWATPTQEQADSAYQKANYTQAVQIYTQYLEQIKKTDPDNRSLLADIYYNLGNCHYRMKDFGKAVLNYQRSLRLAPSNEDAQFNLELTQAKLTDRFDSPSEMFFISWFKSLVYSRNSNVWGLWGLTFLLFAFAGIALYIAASKVVWRKVGFFGACVCIISLLLCETFAYLQNHRYEHVHQAVVMQNVDTFDSPTQSAKKGRTLHEGTTFIIADTFKNGWLQAELPDGSTVWLKKQGIEKV